MRLTSALASGQKWGQMAYVRGIVQYSLSPFEQKAFVGCISKGVPNICRRIYEKFFYVVPPFVMGYFIKDWAEKNHAYRQTKAGLIEYGEVILIKKDKDECAE